MNKLGIIPAAGRGKRFGGALKELLPISNSETLLTRTLTFLEEIPVDRTVLITNGYKWAAHSLIADARPVEVLLVEQRDYEHDVWGAVIESFAYASDMNYYLMPDTYIPERSYFDELPEGDFVMGLFSTVHPERYGVLFDGMIHDKQNAFEGSIQMAWGMLGWSGAVVEFWKQNIEKITSHTQALNMAIKEFGYTTFKIPWYFDIASIEDYKRLLSHV